MLSLRTRLGGSNPPCRGQEAPQRALREFLRDEVGLSTGTANDGHDSRHDTSIHPTLPRSPDTSCAVLHVSIRSEPRS